MTKSPRKNVPDVEIELGPACMPGEHASDRATEPGVRGCDQYISAITSITKKKKNYIFCVDISETVRLANGLRFFSQYLVIMAGVDRRWRHISTKQ